MNKEIAREYFSLLLKTYGENEFHHLLESGDIAVGLAEETLEGNCSDKEHDILMKLLAEIRTEHSRQVLARHVALPFSKRWIAAAEALWFNDSVRAEAHFRAIDANGHNPRGIEYVNSKIRN